GPRRRRRGPRPPHPRPRPRRAGHARPALPEGGPHRPRRPAAGAPPLPARPPRATGRLPAAGGRGTGVTAGPPAGGGARAGRRRPARWQARVVRDVLSLRLALQALAAVLDADAAWRWWEGRTGERAGPVVTAGPEGVVFEALCADGSAHAVVTLSPEMLQFEG